MRNPKTWGVTLLLILAQSVCWAQDFYFEPGFNFGRYTPFIGKNRNYYIGTFMKIHLNSIDYIEWTFGANLF